MSVFGLDISAYDVEVHVRDTLQYWFEAYLQQRELDTGFERGSIVRPASWRTVRTFDEKNPEDAVPFIAIVSDGLAEPPVQEGDGTFRGTWTIGVGVVLEAANEQDAQILVKHIYIPVIRKIMLQKQSLRDWENPAAAPWAAGTAWLDEDFDEIVSEMERTLFNGQCTFEIEVAGITSRWDGPTSPVDPITQPGSEWPTIDSGSVKVELKVD